MSFLHRKNRKPAPPPRCQYQALIVSETDEGFWEVPGVDDDSEPDEGFREFLAGFGDWLVEQDSPRVQSLQLVMLELRETKPGSGDFDMNRQELACPVPLTADGRLDSRRLGDWCYQLQCAVIDLTRHEQSLGWFVHFDEQADQTQIGLLHRYLDATGDDANLRIALHCEVTESRSFAVADEQQELAGIEYRVEIEAKAQERRDADEQQALRDLEGIVERQVSAEDALAAGQLGAGSAERLREGLDPDMLG
jgi:hypothetical protein